jgi:hypothetical protein
VYGRAVLDETSFAAAAAALCAADPDLAAIVEAHGLPEFWARDPGLPTLVLLILGFVPLGCSRDKAGMNTLTGASTDGIELNAPTILESDGSVPPTGLVPIDVGGGRTATIWPYTGESLNGVPSDPINLIFLGKADPVRIRAALLALDGDRTAFGLFVQRHLQSETVRGREGEQPAQQREGDPEQPEPAEGGTRTEHSKTSGLRGRTGRILRTPTIHRSLAGRRSPAFHRRVPRSPIQVSPGWDRPARRGSPW